MNSVIAFWWLHHRSISHLASLYHLEVFSDANAANFSFLYRHHCGLLSTAILLLPLTLAVVHIRRGQGGHRPPNFWNIENKCVFSKCTIKVCVSYSQWCPKTTASGMPYLRVSRYLCSWGSNVWLEVEIPWRALCKLKKRPSRVWKEVVAG